MAISERKRAQIEQKRRNRVVHGWAFRLHGPDEVKAIRKYIETGVMDKHFPANYRKLNETVK